MEINDIRINEQIKIIKNNKRNAEDYYNGFKSNNRIGYLYDALVYARSAKAKYSVLNELGIFKSNEYSDLGINEIEIILEEIFKKFDSMYNCEI